MNLFMFVFKITSKSRFYPGNVTMYVCLTMNVCLTIYVCLTMYVSIL